jgi:hypothetical protein
MYLVDVNTFRESPNSAVGCSRHVFISGFLLFSHYITEMQLGIQMFVSYNFFQFFRFLVFCDSKQKTKNAL